MPRRNNAADDREDDFDEEDEFDESEDDEDEFDESGDDEDETIPCPYCRKAIYEDAQRCPYCERYLSAEDAPASAKPWWIIIGVIVALYVVYRWIVG